MAENVNIVIKAFDKTEAAFAGIRNGFAKIGQAADKVNPCKEQAHEGCKGLPVELVKLLTAQARL